jgi:RNA polymerase sigma-70 factor (ECF subfamily)
VIGIRFWTDAGRTAGPLPHPAAADDGPLIAAARADPQAFARLYERYVGRIYHYCYVRLGSREPAEDATSEVFLRALHGLTGFRGGLFVAWLFRIAHNVVQNALRQRPAQSLDVAADRADAAPLPDRQAEARAERAAVRDALDRLPEQQRAVVELQLAGWRDEEVAKALGKRVGAVRMLRYRALERLRHVLADPDEEGTA